MKKQPLTEFLLTIQKDNLIAMDRIATGIEKMNDSNVLHRKAIEINSEATHQMVTETKALLSFVRWIVVVLVLALIVLAGAEKALKFIPQLSNGKLPPLV